MKRLFFLLTLSILASCASKYQTYHFIDKRTFKLGKNNITMNPRLKPGRKQKTHLCAGQVFFNQNAKKMTDKGMKGLLQRTCPGRTHLLSTRVTETWWTTIVYSRSCVEIETICPL